MENKNNYNEEKFDSYLNKSIILYSRAYFKKQVNMGNKEKTIIDDEDYTSFIQDFIMINSAFSAVDDIVNNIELNNALKSLSAIEQSVIFLLFHEDLSQEEAARILEIYSKTVSKIKIRAINKLKKILKGEGGENEK